MNKRPVTVTIIGCLLVVVGVAGFAFHFNQVKLQNAFRGENVWIFVVELAVLVSGVFVLRGNNWARWLSVAWMSFHVVISFFDSLQKVAIHVVFLALIVYSLFRADASAYFHHQREPRT